MKFCAFVGTINHHSDNKQVLDKLQVERERGITVKAQVIINFLIPQILFNFKRKLAFFISVMFIEVFIFEKNKI